MYVEWNNTASVQVKWMNWGVSSKLSIQCDFWNIFDVENTLFCRTCTDVQSRLAIAVLITQYALCLFFSYPLDFSGNSKYYKQLDDKS